MRLSRWLALIALVVGFGGLQVAQRNALFLQGYALGDRMSRMHAQETEVAWLRARVTGLASPMHLAQVAQDRQLKLVAWSTLAPIGPRVVAAPVQAVPGQGASQPGDAGLRPARSSSAAAPFRLATTDDPTTDHGD